ncbi:hypothetical protein FPQ18DRAFT_342229 [Pyronema domesticum]|nr:hypothetical protein FPQ18DRAFT_342229 [Pyronema domesticum]
MVDNDNTTKPGLGKLRRCIHSCFVNLGLLFGGVWFCNGDYSSFFFFVFGLGAILSFTIILTGFLFFRVLFLGYVFKLAEAMGNYEVNIINDGVLNL